MSAKDIDTKELIEELRRRGVAIGEHEGARNHWDRVGPKLLEAMERLSDMEREGEFTEGGVGAFKMCDMLKPLIAEANKAKT
jgi:hypothetical protein